MRVQNERCSSLVFVQIARWNTGHRHIRNRSRTRNKDPITKHCTHKDKSIFDQSRQGRNHVKTTAVNISNCTRPHLNPYVLHSSFLTRELVRGQPSTSHRCRVLLNEHHTSILK